MSRTTDYADDLELVSEILDRPKGSLEAFKEALQSKGLKVNIKKPKKVISNENAGKVATEGNFPCAVFSKGAERNPILCQFCRC